MLFELFSAFFTLGLFTFGGGYAMIAGARELVTEKKKWLSEEEFLQVIAIAESTPGPIAINMATYVGYKRKGVLGALCATLGVVLPSFVIIYVISLFLDRFMAFSPVKYAFCGISCAVAFLIVKAGVTMLKKKKKDVLFWALFALALSCLAAVNFFDFSVSSVVLIAVGGAVGLVSLFARGKGRGRK